MRRRIFPTIFQESALRCGTIIELAGAVLRDHLSSNVLARSTTTIIPARRRQPQAGKGTIYLHLRSWWGRLEPSAVVNWESPDQIWHTTIAQPPKPDNFSRNLGLDGKMDGWRETPKKLRPVAIQRFCSSQCESESIAPARALNMKVLLQETPASPAPRKMPTDPAR